ncbi:hypothetical protein EW146_g9813 [Bondarzewia mesenterica]|uniref:Acyl-CoA oxidase/dehydrogenase middle domain-containing protein n=1 Tax=Bondarzewia mesenterica TaxID=1095465 RepID=A0A4V3XCG9_9AGAM|nr:hypothetical protein EW146_g9813 [Bondarzewia mesenterica]
MGPEAVNCSAPDTGNMEVLARYGNAEQQKKWLIPLLNGEIRSAFSMTERFVASSDATNIRTSIRQEGNDIVINGHKWYISGAGDPRTKLHLVMGKSDPNNQSAYQQQSVVIVPADAPGVKVIRPMKVFGYDDAPEGHCEIIYDNVRVPLSNLVLGWGKGFEVNLSFSIFVANSVSYKDVDHTGRAGIDKYKAKGALKEIGIAKFVVPSMALQVVDRAIQSFGAEGVSQDTELAELWAGLRTLRLADGPDAVHIQQVGQRELKRAPELAKKAAQVKKREAELLRKYDIKAHL